MYPGKEKLTLIDLVGTTGKCNLCTAPSLLGIDLNTVPKSKQDEIQGDLFDLPDLINKMSDCVESWIRNIEIVDLWAKGQQYNLHNVNWFMMPNGDFILNLKGKQLKIPAQNEIGETILDRPMKMQEAFDFAYLKKPVVYYHYSADYHFDLEESYFDYEKMGFGEVIHDHESLVNLIMAYIENNCQMKDKYKKRVDDFFEFKDKHNCERVYNAIKKIDTDY